MKLPELKEKLKSKYIVRVVAGVLTIALVGTGIGATAVFAEKNDTAVTSEASSESTSTDDIADDLMNSVSLKDEDADKDESVYLISDANGNVNKTIVVDHLKNKDKKDTLEDVSNLSDIENVKGKETFEQNGDKLTWQAGGNDIYYQGTASEEPPVTQKVTYYLDGKEISPEDLAGKSGKVKIRFDYTNTTSFTETVNGEKQTVSVPFAAITGLVLGDGFSNVEVTNGKVQANDSSNIVIGYALPGLKDSLGIKDEDLDDDVNIPEYMEVSADVEDFSLSTAMTFVVNASDYVSSDGINTSSLDDMINDLTDATTQLKDGSADLASGADTLKDGLGTLQSGLKSYTDGASQLNAGINTLGNSTGSLVDGAGQLNSGAAQLASGTTTLRKGADSLNSGALSLKDGVDQVNGGALSLKDGIDQVNSGASDLSSGASDLKDGATQVSAGVNQLADTLTAMPSTVAEGINDNLSQLSDFAKILVAAGYSDSSIVSDGVNVSNVNAVTEFAATNEGTIKNIMTYSVTKGAVSDYAILVTNMPDVAKQIDASYDQAMAGLYQGQGAVNVYTQLASTLGSKADDINKLKDGALEVANGTQSLSDGATALATGTQKLAGGASTLVEGTQSLAKGSSDLASGASTLASGVKTLESGANQLSAGTQSLVDKIPALTSGIKQLVDGSNTLVSNNSTLLSGASQLADGSKTLADGAHTLADGIVQFNEEGINKILDAYNGDLKPLTNKLQAVIDAGEDYQTYSAIADGQTGSVKFIYKLASIESDSDK